MHGWSQPSARGQRDEAYPWSLDLRREGHTRTSERPVRIRTKPALAAAPSIGMHSGFRQKNPQMDVPPYKELRVTELSIQRLPSMLLSGLVSRQVKISSAALFPIGVILADAGEVLAGQGESDEIGDGKEMEEVVEEDFDRNVGYRGHLNGQGGAGGE